jgi:cell division protein FtsN
MEERLPELRPGGLPVRSVGLVLAELDMHGGAGLWDEVAGFVRRSDLETVVDACMGGRAAPRVWAFIEAPGAGPGAAAAAMGAARVLADRGQAVVLVDADEQEPRLTRWLGRTEREGWIDMIRFGASLHAASDPLPSDNRRGSVLGVGSFAPTGVTAEEVAELLTRLRRQADDLILVLPAKLRAQPWLERAQIKLLCWDLLTRTEPDTAGIVAELERMGARPDGIIGFGVEDFAAMAGIVVEDEPAPANAEVEADAPRDDEPAVAAEGDGADAPAEPDDLAAVTAPDAEPAARPADLSFEAGDGPPPRRRSSGIFVFAAAAAVVALVLLGVFLKGQRDLADPLDARDVTVAQADPRPAPPPPPVEVGAEAEASTGAEGPGDGTMPPEETGDIVSPPAGDSGAEDAATDAGGPIGAEAATEPEASTEPGTTPPTEPETTPEPEPVFDPAPFRLPVGEAGWTLWVASCVDSTEAVAEVGRLADFGLVAEFREVEVPGKGTWLRIYSGSFASRADAKAAVDGIKKRIRKDWVVPSRY